MLDDFFVRALLAGTGVALVAGPLGCFIVWRRLAYFGDTLSHAALLGVALGLLLEMHTTVSVFMVSAAISISLFLLQRKTATSSDALLGLLSHSTLAIGLVALAFMTWVRVDLDALLFGDILAVSLQDVLAIFAGGALVLLLLVVIWKPLFAVSVNRELAEAEGLKPDRLNVIFMLLMAFVIAVSIKIVGVLLISSLLIIPAATARRFAQSPEQMAVYAAIIGATSVWIGLLASLQWDSPSGPSIVVAAFCIFVVCILVVRRRVAS